jgi:hypothetical protein
MARIHKRQAFERQDEERLHARPLQVCPILCLPATPTEYDRLRCEHGDSYFYGSAGYSGEQRHSFGRYVLQGTVVDAEGRGIEGIAVRIGKNSEVWSDSGEHFELRTKSAKSLPLSVYIGDSTAPGAWHVLTCATTISFDSPVKIIVSR